MSLRELIGADRILMGSDFPHAEGLADPATYIKDLKNFDFSDEDCKQDHARQRAGALGPPPRLTSLVLPSALPASRGRF